MTVKIVILENKINDINFFTFKTLDGIGDQGKNS